MSDQVSTTPAVEKIKSALEAATALQHDEDLLLSVAGDRVRAILMELLMEVSPRDVQGSWQQDLA